MKTHRELIQYLKKKNITYEIKDNFLSVSGSLYLSDTQITALPDNLSVSGSLYLGDTQITALPDNLLVGGALDLKVNKIKNIAFQTNCGSSKRTIFAAKMKDGLKIFAGCFQGSIDEFKAAVRKKYSKNAADNYIKQAEQCILCIQTDLREKP